MTDTVTASEILKATGLTASTLRAWRNRNGLFPHHHASGGWTRYDFADAMGVAIMVELTARGFAAQDAVNLVNAMRDQLQLAVQGWAPWIGVGRSSDTGALEWKEFKSGGSVLDAIGWFDDPIVITINLNAIRFRLLHSFRDQRGLPMNFIVDRGDDA